MAEKITTTCGCMGVRSCLLCENKSPKNHTINKLYENEPAENILCYDFCIICTATVHKGAKCEHISRTPTPSPGSESFPVLNGIRIVENFVNEEEERQIVSEIDKSEWKMSQSGRRKQDYGPQVNFKKKKLKVGGFNGLPPFSKFFVERMWNSNLEILSDFQPVELCNLEYTPARGSSIDPHIDDEWLWGRRLITLNLLSPSTLTFSNNATEISIPMPRRSLIIVSGSARYDWKHAIKRQDITSRRIAITLRELSSNFVKGSSQEEIGSVIQEKALTFQGTTVQYNLKQRETEGGRGLKEHVQCL